jgi:radical SAM superfamily enzyme YgiQ (UPF0313 family)
LLSIAANIRKNIPDKTIKVLDFNILDKKLRATQNRALTNDDIKKELEKYHPLVSGISFMTSSYGEWGKDLIKFTKQRSTFLFLGGIHPTVKPREIFMENSKKNTGDDEDYVNGIVVGEGEIVFVEIIRQIFKNGKFQDMPHVYTGKKEVERAILNNQELNELPIPAYDLMYKDDEAIIPRLYTSRGCNFRCSMCSVGEFYKTKNQSDPVPVETGKILNDIKELHDKYVISHYVIGDLCSFDNAIKFRMFLEELEKIQEHENFRDYNWWCQTRGDVITEEFALQLKKTRFSQIAIGCEGASQAQLDSIHKHEGADVIARALKTLRDNQIDTQCYWILGLPGETKETIQKTQEKILRYLQDGLTTIPHITILVPYPNTDIYNEKTGIEIVEHDYSKYWMNCDLYGYGKPVYKTVDTHRDTLLSSDDIYNYWLETLQKVTEYFTGV